MATKSMGKLRSIFRPSKRRPKRTLSLPNSVDSVSALSVAVGVGDLEVGFRGRNLSPSTLKESGNEVASNGGGGGGGSSTSASGQQELATKRMLKEERFCNMFGLALSEKTLKSFPCFLVAEILIQGNMVVTERHVCFYSNIPGLKRNIKIRFSDVVRLTKEKVYAFFPTGIGVHTRKDKTVFSYVTSRDKLLQFLRTHWENCSEVEDDFCSSVRGSSVDEAQMDGQASSREASVLNDEDSGILVAPSVAASAAANAITDATAEEEEESGDDPDDGVEAAADFFDEELVDADSTVVARPPPPATTWRDGWRSLLTDWNGLPNRHMLTLIAGLVLLCAIVIVYLSYRLNSLQQQLLLIVSMRSGQGQSEMDHLQHRLGGIVETLGGLQEKLGNLRHILHNLHPVENR